MHKKIGEILFEMGHITGADINRALEIQKAESGQRKFGEILMDFQVSESAVFEALAVQFKMGLVEAKDFPEEVPLEKISFNFLENNLILPLSLTDNVLRVAVGDPANTEGLEALQSSFGYEVSACLAIKSEILRHLELLRGSRSAVMQRLIEDAAEDETTGTDFTGEISHLRDLAQEKGIIQLVNLIIENADVIYTCAGPGPRPARRPRSP